jgi:hypothetical protein
VLRCGHPGARKHGRAGGALASLSDDLAKLATLLEAIQSEHTDENKMVTVGRLEREVQPSTAGVHQKLDELTRAADRQSESLMAAALKQQERMLGWAPSSASRR